MFCSLKIDNALLPIFSTHKDASSLFAKSELKLKIRVKTNIDVFINILFLVIFTLIKFI